MAKVKYHIIKTRQGIHPYVQHMMDKNLVAYVEYFGATYTYVIIGRYGTNRGTLRKILKEHIMEMGKRNA